MDDKILEKFENGIKVVTFNRPLKKNAIDVHMYIRITNILSDAATNDTISMVVLTGTGDFYSSGNDLNNIDNKFTNEKMDILQKFLEAFITFPKLLIALVNGPAVGIAATTLGLCDFVFASENAYFYTPFTRLGIVAEACSSFTFPRLMGERKAMEMLMLNYKMSAKEALECGFISDIYKSEELHKESWKRIAEISSLPYDSVLATKKLIRKSVIEHLLKINLAELQELKRIGLRFYNSKL